MADRVEYNPNIIGFLEERGPVVISLKQARSLYGQLPSDYRFVTNKAGRQEKKGLNLAVGKLLTEKLKGRNTPLKRVIFDYFKGWHRDYEKEFGVCMAPFFNMNDPVILAGILARGREELAAVASLDLRGYLDRERLVRKDILNSIADAELSESAERILSRRLRQLTRPDRALPVEAALSRIRALRIIRRIEQRTGLMVTCPDAGILDIYADEIAEELIGLSRHVALGDISTLRGIRGAGAEFTFASRDFSYLMLGTEVGDCTADKSPFQADREVENIYWTVFPWILDRNYQILKVYYDGEFIMKVHLLPLFVMGEDGDGDVVLALDAIETVRAFRDDIEGAGRGDLLERREAIFEAVMDEVKALGARMGIARIYAEKFSNTRWVREYFDSRPEVYFRVEHIIKLDELEDVFYLAKSLCQGGEAAVPEALFMEVQMKNTSLLPRVSNRTPGVKPFAIIEGSPEDGILMKKVIGI